MLLLLVSRTGIAAKVTSPQRQAFANPLSDVTISIIENNALLFGGEAVSGKRLSNVTIFDPVIPPLGDWFAGPPPHHSLFSKLTYPDPNGGFEEDNGLGDITYFAARQPTSPFVWGAGPIFRFPTATEDELGQEINVA